MEWLESLRKLKAESKLSTREIASLSGVSEPTLEKIFAGITANPGINTLKSVVNVLGGTLDDLFPAEETKKSPGSDKSEPRDDMEREFISLVRKLRPAQRPLLLSLLRTAVEQTQGKPGADPVSASETAPEIERPGYPK